MATDKITSTETIIRIAGGIGDGEYLISNGQVSKTGRVNVRCSGTFGAATVSVGYLDKGVFEAVEQPDGSVADFTAFFALNFGCGKQTNLDDGPAIKVASIDGATDLTLSIFSID